MNRLKAKKLIESFLIEDIGVNDFSANTIFEDDKIGEGIFTAKTDGIISGTDIISLTYEAYGKNVDSEIIKKDKSEVKKGDIITKVKGSVTALLTCERVILNLMQHMSGIATATSYAVKLLDDNSIRICDTRKTLPGLRMFEKYAVTCGGGFNHRFGLFDGVMLKDNHIAFAGGIENAVKKVRSQTGHMIKIEVETENAEQVKEAVRAGADIIMFDNRTPEEIKELVKLVPKHIVTEASGGINLNNISSFKGTNVNYISMGAVIHSAMPMDISFNSMEGNKI